MTDITNTHENYSAADMATAASKGFRDGVKHEREACATICDREEGRAQERDEDQRPLSRFWAGAASIARSCAEKIRERGDE